MGGVSEGPWWWCMGVDVKKEGAFAQISRRREKRLGGPPPPPRAQGRRRLEEGKTERVPCVGACGGVRGVCGVKRGGSAENQKV